MMMQPVKEIHQCEVCGNSKLKKVLNLGKHPMCDDLVPLGDNRSCQEYPIEILFCDVCCTAHQRFQIPKQNLFPSSYHYRARHTLDVLNGMRSLVESCESTYGHLEGKKILDVGCNDGSLLSIFSDKNAKTYGVEPTDAADDAIAAGHEIVKNFFCVKVASELAEKYGKFDVITFTNVFAHIEDLAELVSALKVVIHEQSVIIIENHYLGAVIDKFQFDTFYHEHPRTYSCTSFKYIGELLGLQLGQIEFPPRYNGNVRISYVSRNKNIDQSQWEPIFEQEKSFGSGLIDMDRKLARWIKQKRTQIEELVNQYGKLNAKAFPGRAAIPLKLLELNNEHINAVYEKPQSVKIGHYIPGTRIPILPDSELNSLSNSMPLLNLAWHISDEINSYMDAQGYKGKIIDIISEKDFA